MGLEWAWFSGGGLCPMEACDPVLLRPGGVSCRVRASV